MGLMDIITYDGKKYNETTDSYAREEIKTIAIKLSALEEEIVQHKEGVISYMGNTWLITRYPNDLAKRIRALAFH